MSVDISRRIEEIIGDFRFEARCDQCSGFVYEAEERDLNSFDEENQSVSQYFEAESERRGRNWPDNFEQTGSGKIIDSYPDAFDAAYAEFKNSKLSFADFTAQEFIDELACHTAQKKLLSKFKERSADFLEVITLGKISEDLPQAVGRHYELTDKEYAGLEEAVKQSLEQDSFKPVQDKADELTAALTQRYFKSAQQSAEKVQGKGRGRV